MSSVVIRLLKRYSLSEDFLCHPRAIPEGIIYPAPILEIKGKVLHAVTTRVGGRTDSVRGFGRVPEATINHLLSNNIQGNTSL